MHCLGRHGGMHVTEMISGLGRHTDVVVEFVGRVPVLYGARVVGWTSLCTSRTVVIITIVGHGCSHGTPICMVLSLLSITVIT